MPQRFTHRTRGMDKLDYTQHPAEPLGIDWFKVCRRERPLYTCFFQTKPPTSPSSALYGFSSSPETQHTKIGSNKIGTTEVAGSIVCIHIRIASHFHSLASLSKRWIPHSPEQEEQQSPEIKEHWGKESAASRKMDRLFWTWILTFILTHHYEGIGFLLAAKSIFRFGELSKPSRN